MSSDSLLTSSASDGDALLLGLELDVEGRLRVVDQTGADREQRVVSRSGAAGLDVDRDEALLEVAPSAPCLPSFGEASHSHDPPWGVARAGLDGFETGAAPSSDPRVVGELRCRRTSQRRRCLNLRAQAPPSASACSLLAAEPGRPAADRGALHRRRRSAGSAAGPAVADDLAGVHAAALDGVPDGRPQLAVQPVELGRASARRPARPGASAACHSASSASRLPTPAIAYWSSSRAFTGAVLRPSARAELGRRDLAGVRAEGIDVGVEPDPAEAPLVEQRAAQPPSAKRSVNRSHAGLTGVAGSRPPVPT